MPKKTHEEKWSLFNYLDENVYTEWLVKNGKTLLISLAVFIVLLLVGLRLTLGTSSHKVAEYLKADKEWAAVQSSKGSSQKEALEGLQRTLKKIPELHTKYDALIAQELLLADQWKKAEEYANPVLTRTEKDKLPFYTDYSRISLLISQGEYKKSLEKTIQLKEKMIAQAEPHDFGDALFAFNLLRQAFLYQQVGDATGEMKAWHELKQYAHLVKEAPPTSNFSPQAFTEMLAQFELGKVTLKEYIEQRERMNIQ